jgi:serine/threonine protein kinase
MLSSDTLLQNRYKIIHLLGQGGMGAVYLAIDQRLGHQIALKQMFYSQNELLAQAFEREARILARLNHRCLPKVSDHFSEGDSRYLVMQFIEGIDLGELLEKNQCPFSPRQVLEWADNLLDALDYLHNHEPPILHRDIKPQNLKINPRGELFLLDFGLAKDTTTNFSSSLSTPSVIGYTLNYAPIEQIDRRRTSPATDVYSFSATLYHLLTNQLPVDALSRLLAKSETLPDTLVPANQLNPLIPPPIAQALQFGMAMRAEDRPTASQLRQLLKQSFSDGNKPIDEVRVTAAELPKNISVSPTQTPASQTEPVVRITKNTFIPVTQITKSATKPKRSFIPVAVGLIVLLFGAGLSAAIIAYKQFVSSPKTPPPPAPTQEIQNNPIVKPVVESSVTPPSNAGNQNINQSVKETEKKNVPKTSNPKTTSTQKVAPPIKNSSGVKKVKKDPTLPGIVPN